MTTAVVRAFAFLLLLVVLAASAAGCGTTTTERDFRHDAAAVASIAAEGALLAHEVGEQDTTSAFARVLPGTLSAVTSALPMSNRACGNDAACPVWSK